MQFRVPVEFEAADPAEARRIVDKCDEEGCLPLHSTVVASELTTAKVYWDKVPKE